MGKLTKYDTGATRDSREGKLVFDKFLSIPVIRQYAAYMHMNRIQSDGELRAGDNWQNGIKQEDYIESLFRHVLDMIEFHRGLDDSNRLAQIEGIAAICGIMFNSMGWLHEWLKENAPIEFDKEEITLEQKERREEYKTDPEIGPWQVWRTHESGLSQFTNDRKIGFCGQPYGGEQCEGCSDRPVCVSHLGHWKGGA